MLNLRKKSRSKKSGLSRSSSSRLDSINDRDCRVVMLCEEIPVEKPPDSGRGSRHPSGCSTRASELDPRTIRLSRESVTQRKACYVEREPHTVLGITHKVYGYLLRLALTQSFVLQDLFCAPFHYQNDLFSECNLTKTLFLNALCFANMSSDRTLCTKMRRVSHLCSITN